jgi:hypothetical protein
MRRESRPFKALGLQHWRRGWRGDESDQRLRRFLISAGGGDAGHEECVVLNRWRQGPYQLDAWSGEDLANPTKTNLDVAFGNEAVVRGGNVLIFDLISAATSRRPRRLAT